MATFIFENIIFAGECQSGVVHYDVIKWKLFPRYWSFVRGIHRSPVKSPHNGQWRRALMFSFICAWINASVINRGAGDSRRLRADYGVIVMLKNDKLSWRNSSFRICYAIALIEMPPNHTKSALVLELCRHMASLGHDDLNWAWKVIIYNRKWATLGGLLPWIIEDRFSRPSVYNWIYRTSHSFSIS